MISEIVLCYSVSSHSRLGNDNRFESGAPGNGGKYTMERGEGLPREICCGVKRVRHIRAYKPMRMYCKAGRFAPRKLCVARRPPI